ncbi:MAG TPA: hypothetical protein VKT49_23290 [Bryobacteraceae bacterium]|nr:hypothetical protein [Bryobacteraceae bacterium]
MGIPRRELEEEWRERLRAAEEQYRCASEEYRKIQAEFQARSMASVDSNSAVQRALRAENEARAEYVRVLQTFARLILRGEPPADEQRTA